MQCAGRPAAGRPRRRRKELEGKGDGRRGRGGVGRRKRWIEGGGTCRGALSLPPPPKPLSLWQSLCRRNLVRAPVRPDCGGACARGPGVMGSGVCGPGVRAEPVCVTRFSRSASKIQSPATNHSCPHTSTAARTHARTRTAQKQIQSKERQLVTSPANWSNLPLTGQIGLNDASLPMVIKLVCVPACVRACACACVRACVLACVRACVRAACVRAHVRGICTHTNRYRATSLNTANAADSDVQGLTRTG